MTLPHRFASAVAVAAMLLAALSLTACSGSSSPPNTPTPVVLLDTTVTLVQGAACNTSYVGLEFNGVSGKTVAISAVGTPTLRPLFTLYAPDFATQLGGSSSSGAGAASLTFTLTQTGLHHVSLCDLGGTAGTVRFTVTQQP